MHRVRSSLMKIALVLLVLFMLSVCALAADRTAGNMQEFYQAMFEGLSGLEETFTIRLQGELTRLLVRVDDVWGVEQVRAMATALPIFPLSNSSASSCSWISKVVYRSVPALAVRSNSPFL